MGAKCDFQGKRALTSLFNILFSDYSTTTVVNVSLYSTQRLSNISFLRVETVICSYNIQEVAQLSTCPYLLLVSFSIMAYCLVCCFSSFALNYVRHCIILDS